MKTFFLENEKKIAKFSLIIICLALIRTVGEPFRLDYYLEEGANYQQVKPFLLAAFLTSIGLMGMTLFYFYEKYRILPVIAVLIIITMLIIKSRYSL